MHLTVLRRCILFLIVCGLSGTALRAQQISCHVQTPSPDAAAKFLYQHDYSKAFELYVAAAKINPNDLQSVTGQVRSLLGEQQVEVAAELAEKSLDAHPKSAVLATALGEVQFRQGRLADAIGAYRTSVAFDPCLARTRYDLYKLLWIESMHTSAYR